MIKIYGKNCVYAAIHAKSKLEHVFVCNDILRKDNNIIELLKEGSYKYKLVDKQFMDKEFGDGNQGYGAYRSDYKTYDDEWLDILPKNKGRVLILDGIQDPHNLGAVIRSVDAFGYDLILLPKNNSVSINRTVAHVSTGAIEYTKIAYTNSLNTAVSRLKEKNYWICGTDASGNVKTSEIDKSLNLAVIIGSEGFGMSRTLVKAADYLITIPMKGHVNSLNASVSAGIVLKDLMVED